MVFVGHSFFDVIVHARKFEHLHREAQRVAKSGLDMRIATIGPALGPTIYMIGYARGFYKVSPAGKFRPL